MKLYNTATKSVEDISPREEKKIGLYACGPTVYDFAHIGHMRKYTMDDVLVRTLKHSGYAVTHVMNITDVGHLVSDGDDGEDKMEKGARKYQKTVWEVAKEFEDFFWKSLQRMNVARPDVSCRATEHIAEQIALIQQLEKKGYTYIIPDGVYFDSSTFDRYGDLAGIKKEDLLAGARVEMVEGKRLPTDFALWKFSPPGEKRQMEWESPWAPPGREKVLGFPGWHIECSAMAMKYLGDQFDIHTGGIDHIPIHHTNEIAQSECASGKHPFVRYWVHHNFLRVEGEKMSKSLGNFLTMDDIIAHGIDPMALKLLFLSSHYRSELNFTWENVDGAAKSYARLINILRQAKNDVEQPMLSPEKMQKVQEYRDTFFAHMENDMHTSEALAVLWEVVKSNVPSQDKYDLLVEFDTVLGLDLANAVGKETSQPVPSEIQELLNQRAIARAQKDFTLTDSLRDKILASGWNVQDTPSGQRVEKL